VIPEKGRKTVVVVWCGINFALQFLINDSFIKHFYLLEEVVDIS